MKIKELAGFLGGSLENVSESAEISGVNTLQDASASEASFLANMHYKDALLTTSAAAVLVSSDFSDVDGVKVPLIRVADPYLSFATLQRHFHPDPVATGLRHPSAVVDSTAALAEDVNIGAQTVIGRGVQIASGTIVEAGCVIEDDVVIGERCRLHARSVICHGSMLGNRVILQAGSIIGSDGFGYAWSGSEHMKIPQTGRAVLEDDVEIGANSCVDRGALGDTVIRQGVKLDNQIQIGHNVEVGAYSIMASQVGISGSTKVGAGCQIGGQVGIAGHLNIGDGVQLAAKSGVIGDLKAGQAYAGFPAIPHRSWLKMSALMGKLPEMWKLLKTKT